MPARKRKAGPFEINEEFASRHSILMDHLENLPRHINEETGKLTDKNAFRSSHEEASSHVIYRLLDHFGITVKHRRHVLAERSLVSSLRRLDTPDKVRRKFGKDTDVLVHPDFVGSLDNLEAFYGRFYKDPKHSDVKEAMVGDLGHVRFVVKHVSDVLSKEKK